MSTQGSSFIARIVRAIVDALKAKCESVCERREQIRWLSVR
jgi:hypothetical protein